MRQVVGKARRCTAERLTLASVLPDPTSAVLRPAGRLDAATEAGFRRWLTQHIVFHLHVRLDLARLVGERELVATVLAEARRRAESSHVTLSVVGTAAVPHRAMSRRAAAQGWRSGRATALGSGGYRSGSR